MLFRSPHLGSQSRVSSRTELLQKLLLHCSTAGSACKPSSSLTSVFINNSPAEGVKCLRGGQLYMVHIKASFGPMVLLVQHHPPLQVDCCGAQGSGSLRSCPFLFGGLLLSHVANVKVDILKAFSKHPLPLAPASPLAVRLLCICQNIFRSTFTLQLPRIPRT